MREKVIIIGAGGHARSVMDILLENNEYEIGGCLDPVYPVRTCVERMEDIPIIGTDDELERFYSEGIHSIFVALGNNSLRKKIQQRCLQIGYQPINVISKYARISSRAELGSGICIMAGAVINVNCRIGDGCIINTNCSIDHDCMVGDFAHIAPGVAISGTTSIGEGTHIGTNAAVIDGITIGKWSYIGAGAAVVKDVAEHTLAYGVPARPIKNI